MQKFGIDFDEPPPGWVWAVLAFAFVLLWAAGHS